MKEVSILEKQRIYDGFFKLDEYQLRYQQFNGEMGPVVSRLNFERGDGVSALIYNTDEKAFVLIEQFRLAAYLKGGGWVLETVAGMLGPGEEPEAAISREIVEEVGYKVEKLSFLTKMLVSPGGTTEHIYLFYAQVNNLGKVAEGGGLLHENEDIRAHHITTGKFDEMIREGTINDAKTITSFLMAQKYL